jgi:hypothetical protein
MKPVLELNAAPLGTDSATHSATPLNEDASLLSQVLAASPAAAPASSAGVLEGQAVQGHALPGQVLIGTYQPSADSQPGQAQIHVPGMPPLHVVHTLVALGSEHAGRRVALSLMGSGQALVLGFLWEAQGLEAPDQEAQPTAHRVIEAQQSLELRCGEAAIVLTADGHLQLQGIDITSHARATQRILGGSVHVN